MWTGITPVGQNYDPIVCESHLPIGATILNAGPGTISVKAWQTPKPNRNSPPDIHMELRPGAIRFLVSALIRVGLTSDSNLDADDTSRFAAVAWRIAGTDVWSQP